MVAVGRSRSVEKTDQKEVEYMRQNTLWIDTRLNEECMKYLNDACSGPEHKESHSGQLAGNIFKSELIEDKDNWFFETIL